MQEQRPRVKFKDFDKHGTLLQFIGMDNMGGDTKINAVIMLENGDIVTEHISKFKFVDPELIKGEKWRTRRNGKNIDF